MSDTIIFSCRLPPNVSLNALHGFSAKPHFNPNTRKMVYGHVFVKSESKAWRQMLAIACRTAMAGRAKLEGDVAIHVLLPLGLDSDNLNKSILDALKNIAFGDDSCVGQIIGEHASDLTDTVDIRIAAWQVRTSQAVREMWYME